MKIVKNIAEINSLTFMDVDFNGTSWKPVFPKEKHLAKTFSSFLVT